MKKLIFSLSLLIFSFIFVNQAIAQSFGLNETAGQVEAYQNQRDIEYSEDYVAGKIGDIIGAVLSFVGVIFLVIIIYGGIMWMTSGGNEQKVDKAKTMIINAAIGLLIVFAAYTIVSFIGNQFVEAPVSE